MSDILQKAIDFATEAHKGQKRKFNGNDYIVHPLSVAKILETNGFTDEEMICAALLHDTMEDCGKTKEDISSLFGERIANLVDECTDKFSEVKGRPLKKLLEAARLSVASEEAQNIKLADAISNVCDIFNERRSYTRGELKYVRNYLNEKLRYVKLFQKGKIELKKRLAEEISETYKKVEKAIQTAFAGDIELSESIKWHESTEVPASKQVIARGKKGEIKVCGIEEGNFCPHEWISLDELFEEIARLSYIVNQFSSWETCECEGKCPFASMMKKTLIQKGYSEEEANLMVCNTTATAKDGKKCSDFCGMKGREAECAAESYRLEFDSKVLPALKPSK